MAINKDKPHLWKQDVFQSVDLYNNWFINFAPQAYREKRQETVRTVEGVFAITNNLLNITTEFWVMEWDAGTINLYCDDELLNSFNVNEATSGKYNPFRRPQYMKVNLAIGGDCGGDPSGTAFPLSFYIDYFRVYQKQ